MMEDSYFCDTDALKLSRSKPPGKADLVRQLKSLMSDEQWGLIRRLTGKELETEGSKANFLSSLLVKPRKHSSAKAIARDLQQWACGKISWLTETPWGKDEEIASREMGQSGPDVRMSERIRGLFSFTSECKSGENWSVLSAIRQCQANLYEGTDWLVILDRPHRQKDKRIPPVVALDGEVFFKLMELAMEAQKARGSAQHDY